MIFFKKDEIRKAKNENFIKIVNNSKLKDILHQKIENDDVIRGKINLMNSVKKFINIFEVISYAGVFSYIAYYLNSSTSSDVPYHETDYLIMIGLLSLLFLFISTSSLLLQMCIPGLFYKRKQKLFNFKEEELLKISQNISKEDMNEILTFIENNNDEIILKNINFQPSIMERKLLKEEKRKALIEHIYTEKDKNDE